MVHLVIVYKYTAPPLGRTEETRGESRFLQVFGQNLPFPSYLPLFGHPAGRPAGRAEVPSEAKVYPVPKFTRPAPRVNHMP